MSALVASLVAVPLLAAALTLVAGQRLTAQRMLTAGGIGFVLAGSTALLVSVDASTPVVARIGGWPSSVGITLVVDRFSAMVLTVSALVLAAVLWYAAVQLGRDALDWWFHTKYLVLASGIALSLTTADLFNLFVGFEMVLVSSYVLLTVRAGAREVRSTMSYVVINLIASALFLTLIAFVYASTGTMNLAVMSERIQLVDPAVRSGVAVLMLVVFGIKAALFPLFMWLPDSYPTAPTPVTAVFAGLLTKVGVVVIIRTRTLLFPDDGPSMLILTVAGLTMLVGVFGAIAQNDVKRILSFHIVSQIGYMMMGLGLASVAGLAAAVLYIVHHIVVKTGLFLVGGMIEAEYGSGALDRARGLLDRKPVIALLFLPLAASLAGLPPFSGFVAKLALLREGIALDRPAIVAVSLLVSLLTLFSMTKIWGSAFWGSPPDDGTSPGPGGARGGLVLPTALLVGASLAVAAMAGPLHELSVRAAADLLDPSFYRAAAGAG